MSDSVQLRSCFGERVKTHLVHLGMTVEDLASQTQMTLEIVSEILEGSYSDLTLLDMSIIAKVIGTSPYSLLVPRGLDGDASS